MNEPLILTGTGVSKSFRLSSGRDQAKTLTALDDVSLQLAMGESLGIAGESGCGKSTLAKIMAGLMKPDLGVVAYKGTSLNGLPRDEQLRFRRTVQMIFQDPFSSLNPRMRIGDSISEPFNIAGMPPERRHQELIRIMNAVGLDADFRNRFPDEFSGGQRQRIGIARALAANPEILIADEPVSSLDISIQAQIINLLLQMKNDYKLTMMIISHNLIVLRHICSRIIIMYLGIVVENAPSADLFQRCRHPYTEALLAAIPGLGNRQKPGARLLNDDLPSPVAIPSGCRFHPRCRYAIEICRHEVPPLSEHATNHSAACHLSKQLYG